MAGYKIISSDSHVIEPPDLWTERIDPKYKDQAPRVVAEEEGDWWYIGDIRTNSFQSGTQPGVRFEHPEDLRMYGRWEDVRAGGYLPDDRMTDQDMDGVEGEVIYPTEGLLIYGVPDSGLLTAMCRTYNQWLSEFCSPYPGRMKGIAMINVDNIEEAVGELESNGKAGLVGAMITVSPRQEMPYSSPEYDPFWATAQEMDMPLSLHIATGRPGPGQNFADPTDVHPSAFVNLDYWVRMSLARIIFSGAFERYPNLKVVSVEHELAWAPYFIDMLDYTYTQRAPRGDSWQRFKGDALPSDFFHRNVYMSFQEDGRGIRDREAIGVDNLMWGSDYPHTETTFPRSKQILDEILEGVPEDDKAKIVGGNAATVYDFN